MFDFVESAVQKSFFFVNQRYNRARNGTKSISAKEKQTHTKKYSRFESLFNIFWQKWALWGVLNEILGTFEIDFLDLELLSNFVHIFWSFT